MMTGVEEKEVRPPSFSPDTDGRSETDDFDHSSVGSAASTAALRVTFDLHRHNEQLLRDKHEMEIKHNEEVASLRRQILDLEQRLAQLTATSSLELEKENTLKELVNSLSQRNKKLEIELEKHRMNAQRLETLNVELEASKESSRVLQEENKQKALEINDLKHQLSKTESELASKNEELALLSRSAANDENDAKIMELRTEIEIRDQLLLDLQTEREADDARMQSVMDVQMAHEALRKSCQEKDRHIQHLEEVLDQTIREKEQLSSAIMKDREELRQKIESLDKLEERFNEFKRNAELQYEDTCQQYIAKLNAMSMISYGATEYPGKDDNVFPPDEKLSLIHSLTPDHDGPPNRSPYIEYGTEVTEPIRCQMDLLVTESARTIEALRSEYEIELARNAQLQRENDRLVAERERLKVELYGEMQNGSLSSLNCVLLTRKVDPDGDASDAYEEVARSFRCLKEELKKSIVERDEAKAKLERLMSDLERLSALRHDLELQLELFERENTELRSESKQEKRKLYYDNLAAMNRCKALIYQKHYLTTELSRAQKAYSDACKRFSLNGLTKRNGDTSISCIHLRFSARNRFRVAVFSVVAAGRMRKLVEKRRKQERLWFSG